MAFANRVSCYVCDRNVIPRLSMRLNRGDNIDVLQIATYRRQTAGNPPIDIQDDTKICFNCNNTVMNDIIAIENNPNCLRLNVLSRVSSRACIICNARQNIQRLSLECRVDIFVASDIYVPDFLRICGHHLDHQGFLPNYLHGGLNFVNKPYIISNLQHFLQIMRTFANRNRPLRNWEDINCFTEDEFKYLTSISKNHFRQLLEFCDIVEQGGKRRNVERKHLLTFLIKMKHGVSDEFLKILFSYPSRQTASFIISNVRLSLLQRFVPNNIGFNSITRENYINSHVSPYTNQLYNPTPDIPKAIVYIDCTYNKIEKSSNFRVLRQSYCFHKNEHLVKPEIIVAPDGYILAINGPYFADARNNDASVLNHELQIDLNGMKTWFQEGDIVIVDRGYRDSINSLQELGLHYYMPPFLPPNQRQLTTNEANQARLITTTRWIVEARNGHFKSIFKFFRQPISAIHAAKLRDYYLIAGALINKFHPLINMPGTLDTATQMLVDSDDVNIVQARVEAENLRTRNGRWIRLNQFHIQSFPRLDIEYLKLLTGTYHLHLAASYIQDTTRRDGEVDNILEFDELQGEPNFLRFRIFSRFRNAAKHMLWVVFTERGDENLEDPALPITGYYCTCKSGARTLGTCAHVASVIWFLGYARYQENIHFPSDRLLDFIGDAANRMLPEDMDIGPEIV